MFEVREILIEENPPADADYVLIQPIPSGKFAVSGFAVQAQTPEPQSPVAFETLDDAVAAAKSWARDNGVSVIYVKTNDA